jgi:hypothetical protein
VAYRPRHPPPGLTGERSQDRGDLAGGLARARGLERECLLEIGGHALRVGVAPGWVLRARALDHRGGGGGDAGAQALHVGQLLAYVLHRHFHGGLAVERTSPVSISNSTTPSE